MRIGSAAGQLLAIPAEALRGRPEGTYGALNVPISRQVQRSLFGMPSCLMSRAWPFCDILEIWFHGPANNCLLYCGVLQPFIESQVSVCKRDLERSVP